MKELKKSDSFAFSRLDIPFDHLPVYQLLIKKHNLMIHMPELDYESRLLRINFGIQGSSENQMKFHEDLGYMEMHEDKVNEIFTDKEETK